MSDDLVAFLLARLDEERQRAGTMRHFVVHEEPYYSCPATRTQEEAGDLEWGEDTCDCHLAVRRTKRLREVEAMRAILAEGENLKSLTLGEGVIVYRILGAIAGIWRDHPDYPGE